MTNDEVPRSRTSRGPTRLKTMCMKINKGQKMPLIIDVNTCVANGPNSQNFSSYLGVVAHKRISILIDSWDNFIEHERNMIWQDILVCNCFYFVQSKVCFYFVQSEVYCELITPHVECRHITISRMWKR